MATGIDFIDNASSLLFNAILLYMWYSLVNRLVWKLMTDELIIAANYSSIW